MTLAEFTQAWEAMHDCDKELRAVDWGATRYHAFDPFAYCFSQVVKAARKATYLYVPPKVAKKALYNYLHPPQSKSLPPKEIPPPKGRSPRPVRYESWFEFQKRVVEGFGLEVWTCVGGPRDGDRRSLAEGFFLPEIYFAIVDPAGTHSSPPDYHSVYRVIRSQKKLVWLDNSMFSCHDEFMDYLRTTKFDL
jgi:hypothetical protein